LRCLNLRVPRGQSFLIFLSGLMLSVTPAKLGELLKSGLLKESYDIPLTTSAPIIFADRFTDFIALVLLTLFGVIGFGHGAGIVIVVSIVLVVIFAYLTSRRLSLATIRLLERLPGVGRARASSKRCTRA